MRIYAADDEPKMLKALVKAIGEAVSQAEVAGFRNSRELLETAQEKPCDIAFLDVRMPGISGVALAGKLLGLKPDTDIVFVTGYDEYKADAMDLHASDYIVKPVTAEKIAIAMSNLRHQAMTPASSFRAVTFGNFALYVDGKLVSFHRRKSAEILAYLVDRRGTVVSRSELTLVLYDDETHSRQSQRNLSNAISTLQNDLEEVGAAEILYRAADGLAVNCELLSSDLFEYFEGRKSLYSGEYMEQYSWGERFKGRESRR